MQKYNEQINEAAIDSIGWLGDRAFPRTYKGSNVLLEDRLEFVRNMFEYYADENGYKTQRRVIDENYVFKNKFIVRDLYNNELLHVLLDGSSGVLYSRLAKFYYEDYLQYLAHEAKSDGYMKNTLIDRWRRNYYPLYLAATYLTSCKGSKSDTTTYDDKDLARRNKDYGKRKVKKTGMDRRTREYKQYIEEQEALGNSVNPDDEYTERARLHNIESFSGIYPGKDFEREEFDNISDMEYAEWRSRNRQMFAYPSTEEDDVRDEVFSVPIWADTITTACSPEDEVINRIEMEEKIGDARGRLTSDIDRQVFDMLLDGYKHAEIYRELGITKNMFYSTLKRIEKRVRVVLTDPSTDPLRYVTKLCPLCSRELEIDAFGINESHLDGMQTYCKECDAARKRKAMAV